MNVSKAIGVASGSRASSLLIEGRPAVVLAVTLMAASGCVSTPVDSASTSAASAAPKPVFGEPHPDAPEALREFGRFAGRWLCGVNERRSDGSWRTRPDNVVWTFFYTLNGMAIQDIWRAEGQNDAEEGIASNLRVFNVPTNTWNSAWTNTLEGRFELWSGSMVNDEMVLTSLREGRPVKIRFYNLLPRQFQWTYEAATNAQGTEFMPVMQLLCQRQDG